MAIVRTSDENWSDINFVTSSKCAADRPQCVGVGGNNGGIGVIDTKRPPNDRPVLTFSGQTWAAFLATM